MNKLLVLITISFSFIGTSCTLKSDKNENTVKEEVHDSIILEGQANFRDLGGITSIDGHVIKTGMLFRSGTLANLTESDIAKLQELKIKTVVNFLTEEERKARGEDKLPEGVKSIYLPIAGENNEASLVLEARQTGDFSKVPIDFNYKIHDLLTEVGKEAYTGLFNVLSNPDSYPVVFHCSHGVHRTGTASALVLSALGFPWEVVEKDYLLSNDYRKKEIDQRLEQLEKIAAANPNIEDQKTNTLNIEAFYRLKPGYIEGTKNAVESQYGDFDRYFEAIGIKESVLHKMQTQLLEKNNQ